MPSIQLIQETDEKTEEESKPITEININDIETKDDIWYIRMPRTEGLSSTKIRNAISRGESLDDLASEPVRRYMSDRQNMLGRQAK